MVSDCKSKLGTVHRFVNASYAVAVMSAVLTLTGCSVGPNYVKPVAKVNDHWNAPDSTQVSTQSAAPSIS